MIRAPGAIILAAGEGKRLGGPKGLFRIDGATLLSIAVGRLRAGGLDRVTIVVGADHDRVRAEHEFDDPRASWVVNERWRAGRTGSIHAGLNDLPDGCQGSLIHQVDHPFVAASTFRRLVECFMSDPANATRILIPVTEGRRGHPIVIGRDIWGELRALGPDDPLRIVVGKDPARVREIEVADPGIHRNVNEPADLSTRGES